MNMNLTTRTFSGVVAILLVAAGALTTSGADATATPPAPAAAASWPYPNADVANTRVAASSTISSTNVSELKEAWTFKLTGQAAAGVGTTFKNYAGSLAANPVVVNGVVYLQDLDSNVYALALTTGKPKWVYEVNLPEKSGPGPNGVAVTNGAVYGATPTSVFALNAATGQRIWVTDHLLNSGQGTFGIQPQVAEGRVYLASQYGKGSGGGVLLALNASDGKLLWKFNTVLNADHGVETVGAGSGGAWQTPLVSSDGSVTFGIGNPYQTPANAIAHPSKQLYTDSDVDLDATTGKLRWYYQGVPNDFKDYDMQASPIAASIAGVPVVIGGGKMGYVYVMNAKSGKLIWKTPVGKHNGHDNDSLDALEHKGTIKAPLTISPGPLGGVLTNMALDADTIYLATNDIASTYTTLTTPLPTQGASPHEAAAGEVEALNLTTGKVEWDTKVADLPLGAVTVSNDLVFTTLYGGVLIALNRGTGAIVFRHQLPTATNSPIAIAGNTVLVPAGGGGPELTKKHPVGPQLVAYRAP
jgi:alcohol dehydrogenase (cytochrome c)